MPVQYLYPNGDICLSTQPYGDEEDFSQEQSDSPILPFSNNNYNNTTHYNTLRNIGSSNGYDKQWLKSTDSPSGFYSYIDDGVATANDNEYIFISGYFIVNPTALSNHQPINYVTFAVPNLNVIPSSINLNFRGYYTPSNVYQSTTDSGLFNIFAILHTSGYSYHILANDRSTFYSGNNNCSIIASSLFTIVSGGFQTYNVPMIKNNIGINSTDKYEKAYLTFGIWQDGTYNVNGFINKRTTLNISAAEVVVSGEYLCPKGLPLHMIGGPSIRLQTDTLLLNYDYRGSYPLIGQDINNTSHVRLIGDGLSNNSVYLPNTQGVQEQFACTKSSPVMCLNSGGVYRHDIFRDWFFDFNQFTSSTGSINFNYYVSYTIPSRTSSHTLNMVDNSPDATIISKSARFQEGIASAPPNPNIGQDAGVTVADSMFILDNQHTYGSIWNGLPSGDFSIWIGCDRMPESTGNPRIDAPFVSCNDFSCGPGQDGGLYARLAIVNGDSWIHKYVRGFPTANQYRGVLVTYDSGGMALRYMKHDGSIVKLGETGPLASRYFFQTIVNPGNGDPSYVLPSSILNVNASHSLSSLRTQEGEGQTKGFYELGVINSGLSSTDIAKLDRKELFRKLDNNLYIQPITSGTNFIRYESDRYRHFSDGGYSWPDMATYYNYYSSVYYPSTEFVEMNTRNPIDFYDPPSSRLNVFKYGQTYLTTTSGSNGNGLYRNISLNCFLSGNRANFYEDGTLYFSGWIDGYTNHSGGLLDNNAIIRITQNLSKSVFGGPYAAYNPESGAVLLYKTLVNVRAKIACATFSIRSGLNEYIVPLKTALFYYDKYQDNYTRPASGAYSSYTPTIKYYDKTTVYHPSWNGAEIDLEYLSPIDEGVAYNASGHFDRLDIHVASVINDYWSTPPTSTATGTILYVSGMGTYSSGIDLYLNNNYRQSGIDLFCYNGLKQSGNITLFTFNGPNQKNNAITLFIPGPSGHSNHRTLYICGPLPYSGGIPLFTKSNPPPIVGSGKTLYSKGHTPGSTEITDAISLYTFSKGISKPTTLFTKVKDEGDISGVITLFLKGDGELFNSLPIFLYNDASSIFSPQSLFVQGDGLTDGASVYRSGTTLYIGSGRGEGAQKEIPLTLKVPDGNTSGTTMYVFGGTFVTNSLNLSVATTLGDFSGVMSLYQHGF